MKKKPSYKISTTYYYIEPPSKQIINPYTRKFCIRPFLFQLKPGHAFSLLYIVELACAAYINEGRQKQSQFKLKSPERNCNWSSRSSHDDRYLSHEQRTVEHLALYDTEPQTETYCWLTQPRGTPSDAHLHEITSLRSSVG